MDARTGNVISLADRRDQREQPDPHFTKKDEFGRPMFVFLLEYQMDGQWYGIDLWAHSFEEADKAARSMRDGIVCVGKKMAEVPW